jgi:hypothetical protein
MVDSDEVLDALDELVVALEATAKRVDAALERARTVLGQRRAGASYHEIVVGTADRLLVELLSEIQRDVGEAGSRVRRAEARALRREGLSMEAIGRLFGVSRQRVSALLRGDRHAPPPQY